MGAYGGSDSISIGIRKQNTSIPEEYHLSQNYPNPFNSTTIIGFSLPKVSKVKLIIYDILGREIIKLVNEKLNAGSYLIDWNALNIPSGVYFYKLITEGFIETKKMVLLK
jgi:hypothetical protein